MATNEEATIITLQQEDVNRSSAGAMSAVNSCENEAPAALEIATTECKDTIGGLLQVEQAGTLLDDDHQQVPPAGRGSSSSSNNNNMKVTITDLNGAAQPELLTWPNPVTAARLKWCGCLASTPCTHFTNMNQQYYYSAPTVPNSQWPSVAGSSATSLPHATGIRLNPIQQYLGFQQTDIRNLMKLKAQIVAHPMYDQLLAAHVACLRVATPVDHLQSIDAQLNANIHFVASRYSSYLGDDHLQSQEEQEELDRFMAHYIILLHSFKEQLHEHVRVQAMDAVLSCWEIEKEFVNLTGISPIEGCGGTMSDDEEDKISNFLGTYPNIIDFHEGIDSLGLGPLLPTESERSLMERVRLELKSELKQGYKNRIADVREEILRKRRAGKLPTETTAILKRWWNAHSKWPYPTEDEKARLVQETGLELKQINNWFINQRKRNWHSHASTPSTSIPKDACDVSMNNTTIGGQTSNISLSLSCEADKLSNNAQNTKKIA